MRLHWAFIACMTSSKSPSGNILAAWLFVPHIHRQLSTLTSTYDMPTQSGWFLTYICI